ncbi:hypothetical protein BJ878DRAFT_505793 [Calycina marina]|uniref:RRM domain-containing protein n=1 Tax=Calycina marina TaxID=1763456 RepID=A0A9P7Z433_9HELO|nr:hypothetical protein BJ878DRAFT_505793 [Calycina marina]
MSNIVEKVTDTVNDVTAKISNTTITDSKPAEDKAAKDAHQEAVLASAAEGRRLYIGNLAYATTEGELKTFFDGYLIESTSIPKNPRTDRPVGYAFVDLSTPNEAERAIAELSGKEILERKVSVQLARKPEPAGEKKEAATPKSGDEGVEGEGEGRRKNSGRGRGRGRGRGGRGPRAARGDGTAAPETAGPATGEPLPLTDITNKPTATANEGTDTKAPAARTPREPRRERGPPADGVPSKNKVMVANLPYDLTEEKLKELFVAYSPTSAKIALRPIPRFMVKKLASRNEPRKGRGFGFVTLESEELQQKAVAEMNAKEIEGREIAVKVAIDSPDKIDDEPAPAVAEGSENNSAAAAVEPTAA